ncbi:uncharacterized protein J3R85_004690 [Psidium guajava]|nr:uncharacterized protein J3R85_004690 [Psidium guajava]
MLLHDAYSNLDLPLLIALKLWRVCQDVDRSCLDVSAELKETSILQLPTESPQWQAPRCFNSTKGVRPRSELHKLLNFTCYGRWDSRHRRRLWWRMKWGFTMEAEKGLGTVTEVDIIDEETVSLA